MSSCGRASACWAVESEGDGYRLRTSSGEHAASRVVLATGGLSLPKTGSDGLGLEIARRFGHSIVATTPALVPFVLGGSFHAAISGVALEVELVVRAAGRRLDRRTGSLLFTHFGVSGPVVLDVSRAFLRARLEGDSPTLEANLLPGRDAHSVDKELVGAAARIPRTLVARMLGRWLPQSLAQALAADAGCADVTLGRLTREQRQRLVRGLVTRELPVTESRGYSFAEATAGGVPLAEVDTRTMESRKQRGLCAGGRDARRRRPHRRLQLPVGVVERVGRGRRPRAVAL